VHVVVKFECFCGISGMHHQGIFRIPGAQGDIAAYKQQFEQGNIMIIVKSCSFFMLIPPSHKLLVSILLTFRDLVNRIQLGA
jgi:hypothetical protein